MKHHFKVKPLSANRMWNRNGKRTFKTPEYKAFQEAMRDEILMEDWTWPFGTDQVEFIVTAGVSNRGADLDNVIKPFLDTYQNIFDGFNDNKVYYIELHKEITKKGDEYLEVEVRKHEDDK